MMKRLVCVCLLFCCLQVSVCLDCSALGESACSAVLVHVYLVLTAGACEGEGAVNGEKLHGCPTAC